jgi:glycosyltransferase involved in cell wall biosynthesis
MRPLVSVIIPCYMQGQMLPECVASLQAQTYTDWQAIIVNDGSPDNTQDVAASLASVDKRIMVVQKPNGGLSSARNFGLRYADGDYVQFLDADDLLLPGKFEAHLRVAKTSLPSTVTYTDYFHGDYENPTVRVDGGRLSCIFIMPRPLLDFAARWEHDFSIPIHAALFPKALLLQITPPFDETLPNHEDWDMWMRLAHQATEFTFIDEELATYRYAKHSMSRDPTRMWSGFNMAIRKNLHLLQADKESVKCLNYLNYMNDQVHSKGLAKWAPRLVAFGASCLLPLVLQRRLLRKRLSFRFSKLVSDI